MIYETILKIRGREVPILYYNYRCHVRHYDDPNLRKIMQLHIQVCEEIGNRECLPVEGDLITLAFECKGDEQFFYDWLNEGAMHNGEIHFIYNEVEIADIFQFWDCFCVKIEEYMSAGDSPMMMVVYLSPGIIKRNNLEVREKVWKESDPAVQSSAENFVKNEIEKNEVFQENTNFTANSSLKISDAELAVVNAQVKQMKQILEKEEERFKSLLQSGNKDEPRNQQKGNYGEMKSCLNLLTSEKLKKGVDGKRYNLKRIGDDAPNSLDSKIRHGIDGIYENLTPIPDFVIDETKYGTASLSETQKTGPQMGMKWILVRIEKLYRKGILSDEQYEKLDTAIQNKTIDRIVSHVYSENEEIVIKKISLKNGCNEAKTKKDFVFSEWP
ncbi:cytosolic protein [Bacteroides uniformis]|uniref:Cytosolic protein n=1 Tax=Bacteroides uniformis TaxID=820 RepID=A0A3E4QVC6_BACUN|nr:cytosolic protein [Bacteroides uniformis]